MPSQKWSTKFQVAGYGGLENMKHMVVKHFPENIERFVEPFGGLGRITDLVKADEYFINDCLWRRKFGGKIDKNEISLLESSLLKNYRFYFWNLDVSSTGFMFKK